LKSAQKARPDERYGTTGAAEVTVGTRARQQNSPSSPVGAEGFGMWCGNSRLPIHLGRLQARAGFKSLRFPPLPSLPPIRSQGGLPMGAARRPHKGPGPAGVTPDRPLIVTWGTAGAVAGLLAGHRPEAAPSLVERIPALHNFVDDAPGVTGTGPAL